VTVIGPEAPLVAGVAEAFRAQGLRMVGPSAAAAIDSSSWRETVCDCPPSPPVRWVRLIVLGYARSERSPSCCESPC
jgi:phosphoribosylamine--glycine ligase